MNQIGEFIGGRREPLKASELIALLPDTVKGALQERWRDGIGKDGQFDAEFNGYALTCEVPGADLEAAHRQIQQFNAPANLPEIVTELVRLRALTKMRNETEIDSQIMISALAEEMAPYPIDIIQDACRKWARMEKFFPSWAELKDMIDFRFNRRKRLEQALAEAMA